MWSHGKFGPRPTEPNGNPAFALQEIKWKAICNRSRKSPETNLNRTKRSLLSLEMFCDPDESHPKRLKIFFHPKFYSHLGTIFSTEGNESTPVVDPARLPEAVDQGRKPASQPAKSRAGFDPSAGTWQSETSRFERTLTWSGVLALACSLARSSSLSQYSNGVLCTE